MSAVSRELIEIVNKLPEEKAREVVDFARFLEHQTDDLAWENIINAKRPRPKLDAFVKSALAEGSAESLEIDKL